MKITSEQKRCCLFPRCGAEMVGRGLCRNHYYLACRLVKTGKTSWAELEKTKKVLPARTKDRDWFLSGTNVKNHD